MPSHDAHSESGSDRIAAATPGNALSQYLLGQTSAASRAISPNTAHRDNPLAPLLPRSMGQFMLLDVLGVGGMGTVYRARQTRPERIVALKVIRSGLLSPRAVRRFEYESELLARLQHPNIAAIYESGMFDLGEGSQPYFAMELVEGKSITAFTRDEQLPPRQRLELLATVADAVQHAHQRGIVHRDLKPANILVDTDGRPKVLDFGVARATDSDLALTHTSDSASLENLAGTLPYMSLERFSTDPHTLQQVDHRVDVYALGVIGYELLTGRLPHTFTSSSIFEAATILREYEPPSPASLDRALRGDIDTIIRKALEKNPDHRYASAADVAADIRRFLNYEPIHARPPSAMYRLRKFTRRNRALVSGLAAAFVTLLVGVAATTWQAVQARRAEARAEQRFQEAWQLGRWMIADLSTLLGSQSSLTDARKAVVARSVDLLDQLRVGTPLSLDLSLQVAEGYVDLMRVQGITNRPNLGDVKGALVTSDRALEFLIALAATHPESLKVKQALAVLYGERGLLLVLDNQSSAACDEFERCVSAFDVLLSQSPDDLRLWASFTEKVSVVHPGRVPFDESVAQRQLEIVRRIGRIYARFVPPKTFADEQSAEQVVGQMLLAGQAQLHLGEPAVAERMMTQATTLAEQLRRQFPDSSPIEQVTADAYRYLADLYQQQRRWTEALSATRQSIAHYEAVLVQDGPSPNVLHVTAMTEALLVTCLIQLGEYDEAWNALVSSHNRLDISISEDPRDASRVRHLLYVVSACSNVILNHWPDADQSHCDRLKQQHARAVAALSLYEAIPNAEDTGWLPELAGELRKRLPEFDAALAACEDR